LSSAQVELTKQLGYAFRDGALLARALTHRSHGSKNYERLEFLGDSILSFVVADVLYDRFPQLSEGELTRLRATLVRRETLATLARALDLGDCLELGSGELKSGGFDRDSILADALEAVFGAVYKDGGIEAVRGVVLRRYQPILDSIDPNSILKDPKTRLQEYLQRRSLATPTYNVLEVSGEPHQQHFIVECHVPSLSEAVLGEGGSRRHAEQAAATRACKLLNCESDD
jgi:ribonuclease-3